MPHPDTLCREEVEIKRMSQNKHTPGPWVLDGPPDNQIVWSSAENRVCFLAHSNGTNEERDVATGYLIASAPDLLAALRNLATEMRHMLSLNPDKDGGLYRRRLEEADVALARAEGWDIDNKTAVSEMPADILHASSECAEKIADHFEPGAIPGNAVEEEIAKALLAERQAQRERAAKIVEHGVPVRDRLDGRIKAVSVHPKRIAAAIRDGGDHA